MDIESLLPMVDGQPNELFLRNLGPESELLRLQCEQFEAVLHDRDINMIYFYETKTSSTAEKVRSQNPRRVLLLTLIGFNRSMEDERAQVYSSPQLLSSARTEVAERS